MIVRIISVADVFEAFTADRPYHSGRPIEAGLAYLNSEAEAGRMDSKIVTVFSQILAQTADSNHKYWFEQEAA